MAMSLWKSFKLNIIAQLALSVAFSSAVLAEVVLLDRVAAIVDDNIVLQSELEQRTANIYRQIQQSGTEPPAVEIVKKQVLERLILERLQLNIGDKGWVRIADQEIDQTIARIAASNNISVEDYIAQIHASGETMAKIRQEIANEMIIMQVQQGTVMRGIQISEQELNNFLNSEEGKLVTSPDVSYRSNSAICTLNGDG
jgi:peptidyl-prolyl cis-trans isomerase SurA